MNTEKQNDLNEEQLAAQAEATAPHKEEVENAAEAATEAEANDTEEKSVEDLLAEVQAENAQLKDKYLRQVAEFDNYRKRTLKEKTELILNGGEKVLSALLPVLDDLDRALENIEKSDDVATLKEGVSLIVDKLMKTLGAQGLTKMETVGKTFDTDFHEAIALIPAQEAVSYTHLTLPTT